MIVDHSNTSHVNKHDSSLDGGLSEANGREEPSRLSAFKRNSAQEIPDRARIASRVSFRESRNSDIVKAEFRVSFD